MFSLLCTFGKTERLIFLSFHLLSVFKSNERSEDSYIGLADFFFLEKSSLCETSKDSCKTRINSPCYVINI